MAGELPQPLRFAWAEGGLEAEKTITFRADGLLSVRASVKRNGQSLPVRLLWGPGIGNPTPEEREVRGYTEPQAVALSAAGSVQPLAPGEDPGGRPVARNGALGRGREHLLRRPVRRTRRRGGGAGPHGQRAGARGRQAGGGGGGRDRRERGRAGAAVRRREGPRPDGEARPSARAGRAGGGLDRADRDRPDGAPALGARPRRQLGLVDRPADRADQPGDGAVPALQHRERPQDGEDLARDEGDPGALPQGAADGPEAAGRCRRRSGPSTRSTA